MNNDELGKAQLQAAEELVKRSRALNELIRQRGELQKDMREEIWDPFLHTYENYDWICWVLMHEELSQAHPEFYTLDHINTLRSIRDILERMGDFYDPIMQHPNTAKYNHKSLSWKAIMHDREMYNRINDIYLPNSDDSKETQFDKMFLDS